MLIEHNETFVVSKSSDVACFLIASLHNQYLVIPSLLTMDLYILNNVPTELFVVSFLRDNFFEDALYLNCTPLIGKSAPDNKLLYLTMKYILNDLIIHCISEPCCVLYFKRLYFLEGEREWCVYVVTCLFIILISLSSYVASGSGSWLW